MKNYVKLLNENIGIAEEKYLNYKRRNEDLKNTFNYLSLQNNKANKKFNNLQQRILLVKFLIILTEYNSHHFHNLIPYLCLFFKNNCSYY